MTTQELVYLFKLEYDKLDSQDNPDLDIPKIIIILNKAILLYVQGCYGVNMTQLPGFEATQERRDDLQMLVVKDEPLIQYVTSTLPNVYIADISNLQKGSYMHLIRSYSLADNDTCKNVPLYNVDTTHDDLNEVLKDPNRSPSFDWQELPIQIAQDKVWAYTDGTFTPKELKIDYVKYPTKVDLQGYINFNGTQSTNVDSELPEYALQTVVDIAVKIAQGIIKDTEGYQISDANLKTEY